MRKVTTSQLDTTNGKKSLILYKPVAYYRFTMECIQYIVMIHLSEQVRLIELETEQAHSVYKILTGYSQKLWTAYLFTKSKDIF